MSSKKRSQSAYGSLKSVISGGSGKRKAMDGDTFRDLEAGSSQQTEAQHQGPAWAVHASSPSSSHPAITLVASPTASKYLSLDTSTMQNADGNTAGFHPQITASRKAEPRQRGASMSTLPTSRIKPGTLGSIKSWFRSSGSQQDATRAEARLREMLSSSSQNIGKGKATVSVV
jgi:hypothetical protein